MNIKNFLQELSFLITDLETKKASKKLKNLMHKVILRFRDNLTKNELITHKDYIESLRQRILKVETNENELLKQIEMLRNESEMFMGIIDYLKSELEDGN